MLLNIILCCILLYIMLRKKNVRLHPTITILHRIFVIGIYSVNKKLSLLLYLSYYKLWYHTVQGENMATVRCVLSIPRSCIFSLFDFTRMYKTSFAFHLLGISNWSVDCDCLWYSTLELLHDIVLLHRAPPIVVGSTNTIYNIIIY